MGSSVEKVCALSGVDEVAMSSWKKRIRWAASVYGRCLPILKDKAQEILDQAYDTHGVQWRWMTEVCPLTDRQEIRVQEWCPIQTGEYTDGSRIDEAAAGATTKTAEYQGQHATVMDAEMLGISLALESNLTNIAPDSQAAITRTVQLYTEPARSWIELRIEKACRTGCTVMWVKGHSGVQGNEEADRRPNLRAYGGRAMGLADVGHAHGSSCMACVVIMSCDSKTDVCVSISILSSAISSGLTCPGCHWITTGKSVSQMRGSLDYCIWIKSGLSPGAGTGKPLYLHNVGTATCYAIREVMHL